MLDVTRATRFASGRVSRGRASIGVNLMSPWGDEDMSMKVAFFGVLGIVCVITVVVAGLLCSCKTTNEQPGPIVINDFGTWQCFTNL